MCLTLNPLGADPETMIYKKWVYYKVFIVKLQGSKQDWEGWGTKQTQADGNFGLIPFCVDHTPKLGSLIRIKGPGVWRSLCLLVLVKCC